MTPLRQFKGVPSEVLRKAEGKQFVCFHYLLLRHLLIFFYFSRGIVTSI